MMSVIKLLSVAITMVLTFAGCGGGGSSSSTPKTGEMKVAAFSIGKSTVFRVTLKSVSGIKDAEKYDLIGEDSSSQPVTLNTQVEDYVFNTTTIPLEVYDGTGKTVATATLNALDYKTEFDGNFSFDDNKPILAPSAHHSNPDLTINAPSVDILEQGAAARATVQGLDILASGIIENWTADMQTRSIQVPLNCGATQPGNLTPDPSEGYFIINDVMIEFNYAFDNPTAFNNVLSVKFIQSDRKFENMKLYFKLPGVGKPVIDAYTGQILTQTQVDALLNSVTTKVDKNNPFGGTAIAYVDLKVTPFGPSSLVETIVTKVEGDCVIGAQSFTVQDSSEAPEPYKAINDQVDKNTQNDSLILHILGNKVEIRDNTLDVCGEWSATNSGGAEGTLDRWDISNIPAGATFDFEFNAYSVPDKFRVDYSGVTYLNTGWRGGYAPNNEPLEGPGAFTVNAMFTKGTANTFQVLVTGHQPGTAWNYRVKCNNP